MYQHCAYPPPPPQIRAKTQVRDGQLVLFIYSAGRTTASDLGTLLDTPEQPQSTAVRLATFY